MKGKQKKKKSIIQSTGEKQTYASEMKGKRHILGTELCLGASYEFGDKAQTTVHSIKITKTVATRKIAL